MRIDPIGVALSVGAVAVAGAGFAGGLQVARFQEHENAQHEQAYAAALAKVKPGEEDAFFAAHSQPVKNSPTLMTIGAGAIVGFGLPLLMGATLLQMGTGTSVAIGGAIAGAGLAFGLGMAGAGIWNAATN